MGTPTSEAAISLVEDDLGRFQIVARALLREICVLRIDATAAREIDGCAQIVDQYAALADRTMEDLKRALCADGLRF